MSQLKGWDWKSILFWDASDTEDQVFEPEEHMDEYEVGTVVEFERAVRLSNVYGVRLNEDVTKFYETREEAEQAAKEANHG